MLFKIISFQFPLSLKIFLFKPVTASIAVLPIKIIILGSIIDICSFKKIEYLLISWLVGFRSSGGLKLIEYEKRSLFSLFAEENLELFKLAVSLGGVESLIELPRLMTHDSAEGTEAAIEDDLVRISVGLENSEDLIDDLEFALNAAKK